MIQGAHIYLCLNFDKAPTNYVKYTLNLDKVLGLWSVDVNFHIIMGYIGLGAINYAIKFLDGVALSSIRELNRPCGKESTEV